MSGRTACQAEARAAKAESEAAFAEATAAMASGGRQPGCRGPGDKEMIKSMTGFASLTRDDEARDHHGDGPMR